VKLRHALVFVILPVFIGLPPSSAVPSRARLYGGSLASGKLAPAACGLGAGRSSQPFSNRYPALIADHDDIKALLRAPSDPVLRETANAYLKEINTLLRSSTSMS